MNYQSAESWLEDDDEFDPDEVVICRQRGGTQALYNIYQMQNVHWDCVSGGVNKRQNGYSLYALIPYEDAEKLVDCSGLHSFGGNYARICICKSHNTGRRSDAYRRLVEMVTKAKPKSQISQNRPKGQPPCSVKIRELLTTHASLSRKELRAELKEIGYQTNTIRGAIKRMRLNGEIIVEGYHHTSQVIKINLHKQ